MTRVDILAIGWPKGDRDHHILIPVCVELSEKYNYSIKYGNIFNGLFLLLAYRPKMLLISNFLGAQINHAIVKYAYRMGIKVVSLISEGNVPEENAEPYLWGHNKDHFLYLDAFLLWSQKTVDTFQKILPEQKDIFVACGGTGFDRYKLLSKISKDDFLKMHNLQKYKKTVGVAAWGFDLFCDDRYFRRHQKMMRKQGDDKQAEIHRKGKDILLNIYRRLIENNPDTLFILRYHPGVVAIEHTEFYGLGHYENVYESRPFENCTYDVSDLINVSDIWIGYETTTALEAWLMSKTTFLINPVTKNFYRELTHAGSPIVATLEEAQENLKEFFTTGKLQSFLDIKKNRNDIISQTIGWSDGDNYKRSAAKIDEVFKTKTERKKELLLPPKIIVKSQIGYWLSFIPWLCKRFNLERMKFRKVQKLVTPYRVRILNDR